MHAKRILVPVNLEKASLDSLHFVGSLAGTTAVRATLLYVVNLSVTAPEQRVYEEMQRENEQRLSSLSRLFFPDHSSQVRVRIGKPPEEILAEARSSGAELIVLVGPKSRRRVWPFRVTTVERVVRSAPRLTLVLPAARNGASEQRAVDIRHALAPA